MITLVGMSHDDTKGYESIMNALNELKPSRIGFEGLSNDFEHDYGFAFAMQDDEILDSAVKNFLSNDAYKKANQDTVRLYLQNMHFDTRAVVDYVTRTRTKIVFCENEEEVEKVDFDSAAKNPNSGLVRETSKMLMMSPQEYEAFITKDYEQESYPVIDNPSLTRFYTKRDEFTETAIRNLLPQGAVYFGGLDHLFGDYHPNLADRLQDLKPDVRKLSEFR